MADYYDSMSNDFTTSINNYKNNANSIAQDQLSGVQNKLEGAKEMALNKVSVLAGANEAGITEHIQAAMSKTMDEFGIDLSVGALSEKVLPWMGDKMQAWAKNKGMIDKSNAARKDTSNTESTTPNEAGAGESDWYQRGGPLDADAETQISEEAARPRTITARSDGSNIRVRQGGDGELGLTRGPITGEPVEVGRLPPENVGGSGSGDGGFDPSTDEQTRIDTANLDKDNSGVPTIRSNPSGDQQLASMNEDAAARAAAARSSASGGGGGAATGTESGGSDLAGGGGDALAPMRQMMSGGATRPDPVVDNIPAQRLTGDAPQSLQQLKDAAQARKDARNAPDDDADRPPPAKSRADVDNQGQGGAAGPAEPEPYTPDTGPAPTLTPYEHQASDGFAPPPRPAPADAPPPPPPTDTSQINSNIQTEESNTINQSERSEQSEERGATRDAEVEGEGFSGTDAVGMLGRGLSGLTDILGPAMAVFGAIEGIRGAIKATAEQNTDPFATAKGLISKAQGQISGMDASISADQFASKVGASVPSFGSLAAPTMDTSAISSGLGGHF